jgi:hypothetical protein
MYHLDLVVAQVFFRSFEVFGEAEDKPAAS